MLAKLKSNISKVETGQFLRDIVFGMNDAILTNLGIIAGFTIALKDNHFIVLACLVDIFISAFAMSFGTYMSRTSEQDFLKTKLDARAMTSTSDFAPLLPFRSMTKDINRIG